VSLPEKLLSSLPHALAAAPARTMADAFDLYLAGGYLKDQHLVDVACTGAKALRATGGDYLYSSQVSTPDLVSTAEASIICSPPTAKIRARTLAQFATSAGAALTPPSTDQPGTAPTVTMASVTAAVVLDTGSNDPQYLL
jgi:hypothetical protein